MVTQILELKEEPARLSPQIVADYPLSPQQHRIWSLQRMESGTPYRVQGVLSIKGELDVAGLKTAVRMVVARHAILRTSFPMQLINDRGNACWEPDEDLSEQDAESQRATVERLLRQLSEQPSHLRLKLLIFSPLDHRLLIVLPALCVDAAGLKILVREISTAYAACFNHEEFDDEPVPYVSISQWLNALLELEEIKAGKDFWHESAGANLHSPPLPFERVGQAGGSFDPRVLRIPIRPDVVTQCELLAAKCNTSLAECLLACWQVLLWRYLGQPEIVVAPEFDGRTESDLESVLGPLTKYLPLRIQLQPAQSFKECLAATAQASRAAASWQEAFTWESLATSGEPPFASYCFSFQNQSVEHNVSGVTFLLEDVFECVDRYKLKLVCRPAAESMQAEFHYDSQCFEVEAIQHLARKFELLLSSASRNPEAAIESLALLDERDRAQLLVEWNQTHTDYPRDRCVHGLFESQVALTPDALALIFEDTQLTYAELDRRSNQLAHYLRRLGILPEAHVGLCLERSAEMVVALLAILKAGGAYVPLDPQYPLERLAFILDDAAVTVLLTQESLLDRLPTHWSNTVCLDNVRDSIDGLCEQSPQVNLSAGNLAYIIYTSGSTGQPKGVSVTHRNVVRLVKDTNYAAFDAAQVFLQLAPLSFDAATFELWAPLLNGGRLVVAPPHSPTLEGLGHTLQRYGVTTLWLTAGLFQLLVDERPEDLRGLHQLLAGGDVLSAHHVNKASEAIAGGCVINGYGPTETTTFACCYRIGGSKRLASVPIGRPIANAEAYVLDRSLDPVAIGVTGELYIGGDGLARGYHQRPDLTAEKFIPHLFSTQPGARLYKTGDLARFRLDGNLEFIGRCDEQVKVRGFRVEPGEVEAALLSCETIREAVVIVRGESASDKRLVAYVVADEPENATASGWRSFLQARLPEYMIPSTFVLLEQMPLTPNGKVDRRALLARELPDAGRETLIAPRTPVEELVFNIWSELLPEPILSITDNFFDRGGHSLLATRLISSIREAFDIELPLQSIFEQPTLEAFARCVETAQGQVRQSPGIVPVSRDAPLPLSFAQQRLWFLDQMQPGSALYNIPIALSLYGTLDLDALQRALTQVVARHEALRTSFPLSDGAPFQRIHQPSLTPLPLIDLSAMPPAEREAQARRLVNDEAQRPFDLSAGPLLRATMLRVATDEHILMVTMHHIVSDGWSIGVLVREVAVLYDAFSRGEASPLPELPIQYADFAVWQREWLRGEVLDQQLKYWREQLAGAAAVLELPADRERPAVVTYRGGQVRFRLDAELTAGLKQLSQRQGVTMFMTLLASFQTLLYRYSGQESISIGTPIANRHHPQVAPLIGFFVNTLVMRADLSGQPGFNGLLRRTRQAALGAYMHQDVPFDYLVEELNTERSLSHSPLFQVMFAFQNTPAHSVDLPGLRISMLEPESAEQMSKFELGLVLSEELDGITGSFVYHTDLFDPGTIERMATHLRRLLDSIVADPEQNIDDLSLLTETERRELLRGSNGPLIDFAQSACVHQLFEAQVAETPDAIALTCQGEQVSYAELNRRANQVAHYLRDLGVGPEVTVGLSLPRSVEMVVGLLGILKAGGAYVPLDPTYPAERLRLMIEDAKPAVLLTQPELTSILPETEAAVLLIGERGQAPLPDLLISQTPEINQAPKQRTGQEEGLAPAYVIYTSGSTGRPKGVLVEHRQLVNTLRAGLQASDFTHSDVMLCMASSSFDIFLFELLTPLLRGGRSVVLTQPEVLDATLLLKALEEATSFHAVPGLMRLILNAIAERGGGPEKYQHIRQVFVGGDAVPHKLVKDILDAFPAAAVTILYGPTEATIICASHTVERGQHTMHNMIGRPLTNMSLRLYDKQGNLVPLGVTGEIYIGGASVSRGYLAREELTREKFVTIDGERFYRSGDLGRQLPDSNFIFVGRDDEQVKVRGFRVEAGEIEVALEVHPAVRECVVVARDGTGEGKRLIAYVVPERGQMPTTSDLRVYLQQHLPEHMIPSAFVLLESLPLTTNGKVDRRALQLPSSERPELVSTYVAPHTEMELLIASVWSEVLGVEGLGAGDNFFDAGGNSLLLIRVQSKLRSLVKREVSVLDLFKHSTIASLANHLSETETSTSSYEHTHRRARMQKDFIGRQKQKARERRSRS